MAENMVRKKRISEVNVKNTKRQRELASHLVRNHLQYIHVKKSEFKKIVADDVIKSDGLSRVVAIIGAGASKPLGMPLGMDAIQIIKKSVNMPEQMLNAELDRITSVYRLPHNAFETILMALCSNPHTAKKTRKKIHEMYNFRFIPSLCYELLAHMLKHRFIDVIINFNFDELLDQAIEDELDKEEYYYVLSDGDCPDLSKPINPTLDRPFYIKPHGTASHPATLRFTREDYYGLPMGITTLLQDLISTKQQLILLNIGFELASFEFNKILKYAATGSNIYNLNIKDVNLTEKLDSRFKKKFINVKHCGLNFALNDLWDSVIPLFQKGYKPRSVSRHKYISTLFESPLDNDIKTYKNNLPEYLKQRAVIEICLSAAKSKGIININEISMERSGVYYEKYSRMVKGGADKTFYELCQDLGFHDFGYSHEMLRLKNPGAKSDEGIVENEDFQKKIGDLFEETNKIVSAIDQKLGKLEIYKKFKQPLMDLYNEGEVEIKIIPAPLHTKIFKKPKSIMTNSEFLFSTYQLLSNQRCRYLWIVAETGEWLTKENVIEIIKGNKQNVFISLVVADRSWIKFLKNRYGELLKDVFKLPWWKHNRHMTISLDRNKRPISSIYFTRRLKNSRITPVKLDKDDSNLILQSFSTYKEKAEKI